MPRPLAATLYADPAVLQAWRARGGHPPVAVYASGECLDPAHPCAALVRGWIDAGLAVPTKQRGVDGVLRHLVQLTLAGALTAPEMCPHDRRMLQVLRDCAGEALPSNRALALAAGLGARPEAANYRLRKLEGAGLIRREERRSPAGKWLRFALLLGDA